MLVVFLLSGQLASLQVNMLLAMFTCLSGPVCHAIPATSELSRVLSSVATRVCRLSLFLGGILIYLVYTLVFP